MTLVPLALALMLAVPNDFELTLERGPCYGSCPIYRVTIDANGAVVFHGERFTSAVGEHKRAMLIDDVQQLVRAARELDFFTLGNYTYDSRACREYWTDHPTAAITLRMYGHTKTVDHNLGCRGFDQEKSLIAFEHLIDERLRFVHEIWSALPPRELDEVREQVDAAKRMPIAQRSGPRRQVVLAIPIGDDLPSVSADLGTFAFDSLADDRTWTDDAKSIRIEAVPTDRYGDVEPWPAEDLVPVAQLTSRSFTPSQWHAIAARLG